MFRDSFPLVIALRNRRVLARRYISPSETAATSPAADRASLFFWCHGGRRNMEDADAALPLDPQKIDEIIDQACGKVPERAAAPVLDLPAAGNSQETGGAPGLSLSSSADLLMGGPETSFGLGEGLSDADLCDPEIDRMLAAGDGTVNAPTESAPLAGTKRSSSEPTSDATTATREPQAPASVEATEEATPPPAKKMALAPPEPSGSQSEEARTQAENERRAELDEEARRSAASSVVSIKKAKELSDMLRQINAHAEAKKPPAAAPPSTPPLDPKTQLETAKRISEAAGAAETEGGSTEFIAARLTGANADFERLADLKADAKANRLAVIEERLTGIVEHLATLSEFIDEFKKDSIERGLDSTRPVAEIEAEAKQQNEDLDTVLPDRAKELRGINLNAPASALSGSLEEVSVATKALTPNVSQEFFQQMLQAQTQEVCSAVKNTMEDTIRAVRDTVESNSLTIKA